MTGDCLILSVILMDNIKYRLVKTENFQFRLIYEERINVSSKRHNKLTTATLQTNK